MDNFNESTAIQSDLVLDSTAQAHLLVTRKWSMFLSILGLIISALMIIALFALLAFNAMGAAFPFGLNMFFPYLLLMLCYFFPLYYLLQFSKYSKQAIEQRDSNLLTLAIFNLKRHYRFLAILIIIMLILYAFLIFYMVYLLGAGF
jgi:hypothetical protein